MGQLLVSNAQRHREFSNALTPSARIFTLAQAPATSRPPCAASLHRCSDITSGSLPLLVAQLMTLNDRCWSIEQGVSPFFFTHFCFITTQRWTSHWWQALCPWLPQHPIALHATSQVCHPSLLTSMSTSWAHASPRGTWRTPCRVLSVRSGASWCMDTWGRKATFQGMGRDRTQCVLTYL